MGLAQYPALRLWSTLFLSLLLAMPAVAEQGASASEGISQASQNPQASSSARVPAQGQAEQLPDSPGTTRLSGNTSQSLSSTSSSSSTTSAQFYTQENGGMQKPVGTAAAGEITTTGVAASRPQGAALAPAKQRRVRLLMIKVGAVAAAGVALGATMALTKASPGRPPGAQ